jgi:hypothetical protein
MILTVVKNGEKRPVEKEGQKEFFDKFLAELQEQDIELENIVICYSFQDSDSNFNFNLASRKEDIAQDLALLELAKAKIINEMIAF